MVQNVIIFTLGHACYGSFVPLYATQNALCLLLECPTFCSPKEFSISSPLFIFAEGAVAFNPVSNALSVIGIFLI